MHKLGIDALLFYVIIVGARHIAQLEPKQVNNMKEKIHPNYDKCEVRCACGEVFETKSTLKEIKVEICSKCHPFFTGKQKLVDTGGRVDRFKKRYNI